MACLREAGERGRGVILLHRKQTWDCRQLKREPPVEEGKNLRDETKRKEKRIVERREVKYSGVEKGIKKRIEGKTVGIKEGENE